MLVFGHGDERTINTLPSFAVARAAGADGIELDVRRTADHRLVVVHDVTLADGRAIAETARADLPAHIPELAEVLDTCTGLLVNVEIKNYPSDPAFDPSQRVTELVLELLAVRGNSDDVLVSCFDFGCIDLVRASAPQIGTAMLYLSRRPAGELLDAVVEHGHRIVHSYDTMVDEAFMSAARERDLAVNVWLDAGVVRMRELIDLGVDGLITADVGGAVALRGSR